MADEKIVYGVSIDAKSAVEELTKLKKQIGGLGGGDSLSGLIEGLTKVGVAAGVVGAAMFAAKKAFDFTLEAESIRSAQLQFDILSKQAGISSEKLFEGLKKASNGLVDETDLLEIANKSLATFGKSAERLPEILELARKASVVSGQGMKETFETLNFAISTGSTRALKHLGIVVDQDKAYREYAKSIGATVDTLSQQGKQQAVLNEVLSKGQAQFGAVNADIKEATNLWTQLKVTLKDTGEVVALAFDKIAGPSVKGYLDALKTAASQTKEYLVANFGEGKEQLEAQISKTKKGIGDLTDAISTAQTKAGDNPILKWVFGDPAKNIERWKSERESLEKHLGELESKITKSREDLSKGAGGTEQEPGAGGVDPEKVKEQQAQFNKTLEEFRKADLEAKRAGSLEVFQIKDAENARLEQIDREAEVRKNVIRSENHFTDQQQKELFFAIDQERDSKRLAMSIQIADAIDKAEITSIERRAKVAANGWDKFALGAQLASAKAKKSLMDFSAFGESSVNTLAGAFGAAFEQMGQGGISLGEALKKSMIGAVADIAAAEGKKLIAMSIFPPNPIGIAAGAGLLALSGVLRSSVGATASVPSGGGTAGGVAGGVAAPTQSAIYDQETPAPDQFGATQRKSVTIQISGHYFDTQETNRQLVQMIRDAADATDYKILSVGGKV